MGAIADSPNYPRKSTGKERVISSARFTVGAAGVISATDKDDPAWTAGTFAAGLSAITMPSAPADARLRVYVMQSAAATVTEAIMTAISLSAGTGTLRTSKAGVAANPASGDIVCAELVASIGL